MDKYEELVDVMDKKPDSEEKLHIIEQWIAQAYETADAKWEYETRMAQSEVAVRVGRYDLLLENFSWCLDFYEAQKNEYDVKPLLWQFKWFLEYLDYFPHLSKEEINEYYEFYKTMLMDNEYSLRSYFQLRTYYALKSGNYESVKNLRMLWLHEDRDELSDCEHCEESLQMRIHFELGEISKGFTIAEKLLSKGFVCDEVPHKVHPYLLLPAWNEDKITQAKAWREQNQFVIKKNPKYLVEMAYHLLFLSLINIKSAYKFYQQHIEIADNHRDFYGKFYFYLASWCMIEKAMHTNFLIDEVIEVDWFSERVTELAKEYDARNENHHFIQTIDEWFSYIQASY